MFGFKISAPSAEGVRVGMFEIVEKSGFLEGEKVEDSARLHVFVATLVADGADEPEAVAFGVGDIVDGCTMQFHLVLFVEKEVFEIPFSLGVGVVGKADFATVDEVGGGHIERHDFAEELHDGLFAVVGHAAVAVRRNDIVGEATGYAVEIACVETPLIFGLQLAYGLIVFEAGDAFFERHEC